jgi:hypothetical protein
VCTVELELVITHKSLCIIETPWSQGKSNFPQISRIFTDGFKNPRPSA